MGFHPVNLGLRFILELCALIATGYWGYNQTDSWMKYVLAIGVPLIFGVLWGLFAVPNDRSRSGRAPIPTPGCLRLCLEIGLFVFTSWALFDLGYLKLALTLSIITTFHYAISYDRVIWLLNN